MKISEWQCTPAPSYLTTPITNFPETAKFLFICLDSHTVRVPIPILRVTSQEVTNYDCICFITCKTINISLLCWLFVSTRYTYTPKIVAGVKSTVSLSQHRCFTFTSTLEPYETLPGTHSVFFSIILNYNASIFNRFLIWRDNYTLSKYWWHRVISLVFMRKNIQLASLGMVWGPPWSTAEARSRS